MYTYSRAPIESKAYYKKFHELPITSREAILPAQEVYILTSQSFITYVKLRPLDKLFQILCEDTLNKKNMNDFINNYGCLETTTILVTMLCQRNAEYYVCSEEELEQSLNRRSIYGKIDKRSFNSEMFVYRVRNDEKTVYYF